MRLVTYERQYLAAMCASYNAQAGEEPHIAPLTPDTFISFVEAKSYFDPAGLFIALEAGEVVGWVHACVAPASEAWQDGHRGVPRIRMLVYHPDRLDIGTALVSQATDWLAERAEGEIEAMHCKHGYPFYRGLWMGGEPMNPTSLPHLHVALEDAGYRANWESVFMVRRMGSPPAMPAVSLTLEFEESRAEPAHAGMRESWIGFEPMRVRAMHDGASAGEIGWVLLPHVAPKLGAPCVNIWMLGVREEYRRKGVASALMARALTESYHLGARFGSVGTQIANGPAQRLYAKFGFGPHCLLIGRELLRAI